MIEWNEAQPGFNVSDLAETEQNVRCQFSKKHVVYEGAHEACGCGFQHSEYGPENRFLLPTERTLNDYRGRGRLRSFENFLPPVGSKYW